MSDRRPIRVTRLQQGVVAFVLVALALGSAARAVAEDAAGSFRFTSSSVLMTPRDPVQFLRTMTVDMPRPVVVLTQEDAVAHVLLQRTRTLSDEQAMRTAAALCNEAHKLGYDPLLFLAVIYVESNFNHLAVSPVGAEGLMQLMPYTAASLAQRQDIDWSENHSFDPVLNVRLGTRYLVQLHHQFKRLDYALTAYNRGPQATWHILKHYGYLPRNIRDFYAGKVLQRYHELRAMYGDLPWS